MNVETWKPISGFEGVYEVSDLGRVRSLDRKAKAGNLIKGKQLSTKPNKSGRVDLRLWKDGELVRAVQLHVLVTEEFHGPRPDGHVAKHIDDDSANNAAANLAWMPRSETHSHCGVRGSENHLAKLTEQDVIDIFYLASRGHSYTKISRAYGVDVAVISRIINRKTWKHVQRN